jgi:hypothetical protein
MISYWKEMRKSRAGSNKLTLSMDYYYTKEAFSERTPISSVKYQL